MRIRPHLPACGGVTGRPLPVTQRLYTVKEAERDTFGVCEMMRGTGESEPGEFSIIVEIGGFAPSRGNLGTERAGHPGMTAGNRKGRALPDPPLSTSLNAPCPFCSAQKVVFPAVNLNLLKIIGDETYLCGAHGEGGWGLGGRGAGRGGKQGMKCGSCWRMWPSQASSWRAACRGERPPLQRRPVSFKRSCSPWV